MMVLLKSLLPIAILLVLELVIATHGYTCSNPKSYVGESLCDFEGKKCGECVSFVKICTNDRRQTTAWRRGQRVRGANIPDGTAIATFPGDRYSGHAAIYVSQNNAGIQVYDQWKGRPVGVRTIRWNGNGISNNGASFYVID